MGAGRTLEREYIVVCLHSPGGWSLCRQELKEAVASPGVRLSGLCF